MKIAFLVLNHRPPQQLLRLLATLRRQLADAPLVVHHDKFKTELKRSAIEHLEPAYLLTSEQPMMWGDFSIVDAIWRSLSWIVDNLDFDWLILLSAQDYPIKPLRGLADHLSSSGADALLRAAPIQDLASAAARRDRRRRYLYQYRPVRIASAHARPPGDLRTAVRARAGGLVDVLNTAQPFVQVYKYPDGMPWRIGVRARAVPFTETEPCWFGAMWWGLSRRAAARLLASSSSRPEMLDYYRNTVVPDESVIATILSNDSSVNILSEDVHYTRWTGGKSGHPDVFGIADFVELSSAPQFFARKFDPASDAAILDLLDELIAT